MVVCNCGHSIHRGRGRELPSKPIFHVSVKERMKYLRYKPKAEYTKGEEVYYDTKATEAYYDSQVKINRETPYLVALLLLLCMLL